MSAMKILIPRDVSGINGDRFPKLTTIAEGVSPRGFWAPTGVSLPGNFGPGFKLPKHPFPGSLSYADRILSSNDALRIGCGLSHQSPHQ